jgi:predicted dehydrogenase/uncharacterized protein YbjT (DUF2867 family)
MTRRIGLVGAGYIAQSHVEALATTPGVALAAIIDPNLVAAERLAKGVPGARAFGSLDSAIKEAGLKAVHILTPPELHVSVASEAIAAGLDVFVEKPLATSLADAQALIDAAGDKGVTLGVNQNFVTHPAVEKLMADIAAERLGKIVHVSLHYAVPLRQLEGRQFGHWMFASPTNILLEQAVHPLSQIARALGCLKLTSAQASPAIELAPGAEFHTTWDVQLAQEQGSATAHLHMLFGNPIPHWQMHVICQDGVATLDMFRNHYAVWKRSRFLDQGDTMLASMRYGAQFALSGAMGVVRYGLSQLKLGGRSDPFFVSMATNIRGFHHAAARKSAPPVDGAMGLHVMALAEGIAQSAQVKPKQAPQPVNLIASDQTPSIYDVAVFGGTGFIGRVVVAKLIEAGYSVGVIARNVRNLPVIFSHSKVSLVRGDVTRAADIARGIGSAKIVINLAHGGASGGWDAIQKALVGSAVAVGEACLESGVKRLVHVSTIAALYLGDADAVITPNTPPDPNSEQRGDYGRAKADAERALLALHQTRGLPVTIQRPGVVVGEGASPFHSGLGLYNNEQHCLGWNDGQNPLPFVLVEDAADAIVKAIQCDDSVLGRTDNIVGDVRLSARTYYDEVRRITGRPLAYHPQPLWLQQAVEYVKWAVKRAGGRKVAQPSMHDLRSRGMVARFDTADTKHALNWMPVTDRAHFVERGIAVAFAPPPLAHRTADETKRAA